MINREMYEFGIIGLGTMGRNLLLNMADHGIVCAGYDKNSNQVEILEKESKNNRAKGFTHLGEFVASLKTTRSIILLVPAGKIVDNVIEDLLPLLDKGDIIIDGGNSHFTDTDRRVEYLQTKGLHFFGMGISGGEEGARFGPSLMPGGDKAVYHVMKPTLEAIAAKADGSPCVTYIGRGSAGHFVKMVHNGIEYALMQLIADTYEYFKKGLGLKNEVIGEVFARWDEGRLQSFLLEITRDIFAYKEPKADHLLIDDIKDEAKAEGTGKWTSQVAMDLHIPTPTIDMAVSMRDLSKYKLLREEAAALYPETNTIEGDREKQLVQAEQAFYFCMINIYAQGMHLLSKASEEYHYELKPAEIARIWRGGCIIRSAFLNDIYQAFENRKDLEHLLLDPPIAGMVMECENSVRQMTANALVAGLSIPAYTSSLSYFDGLHSKLMPSNLIQAQRDYFGAHTYELRGKDGVFHTIWKTDRNQV